MIGHRVDSETVQPPTVAPGDYGFNGDQAFFVRPPVPGVPSLRVDESRVTEHWRFWPFQTHRTVTVKGLLAFWRGLGEERRLIYAGHLRRGEWIEADEEELPPC